MTKEELKQEAKKYARRKFDEQEQVYLHAIIAQAYIEGAEPRENKIKSLGERCLQLQKDKGNLTDSVRDLEEKLANADYQLEGRDLEIKELKEQIEEMKCCYNCKHSRTEYEHCRTEKSGKWEMKEK